MLVSAKAGWGLKVCALLTFCVFVLGLRLTLSRRSSGYSSIHDDLHHVKPLRHCPSEPERNISNHPYPYRQDRKDLLTKPPKAAIVMLVRSNIKTKYLKQTLGLLSENWYMHPSTKDSVQEYPIYLFHTQDYTAAERMITSKELKEFLPSSMQFEWVQVDFSYPPDIDPTDPEKSGVVPSLRKHFPGYMGMINFFLKDIFEHPKIRNLDYFWRLDTDSWIHSPLWIDPFRYMQKNNLKYIYRIRTIDLDYVTQGMLDFIDSYLLNEVDAAGHIFDISNQADYPVPNPDSNACRRFAMMNCLNIPSAGHRDRYVDSYYNNFEIVDVQRFRQPDIRHFANEVYRSRRVFTHRWGDAPLRFYATHITMDVQMETLNMCWIDYEHQGRREATCARPPSSE